MVFVGAIVMTESMLLVVATTVRRRCIEKLKEAKALSPETAVAMDKLKLDWLEKRHFKRLAQEGKIKKTEDGRYYMECKDGKHC
jgi:hypothetical protein